MAINLYFLLGMSLSQPAVQAVAKLKVEDIIIYFNALEDKIACKKNQTLEQSILP